MIGAGQMGSGIAQVSAQAGFDVVMNDISEERLQAALATINGLLARLVAKGQIGRGRRARRRWRASPPRSAQDKLGDCDLVIEAASENEEVKRKIFAGLRPFLKPDAIVASNTSSISITRLASVTDASRALHRHSFHESGAAHAAGRADSRHRHRGRRPSRRPGASSSSSARR